MAKVSLKKLQTQAPDPRVSLETSLDVLYKHGEFRSRTFNALNSLGIKNTNDVLSMNPASLHDLPKVGATSVAEVMAFMIRYRYLKSNSDAKEIPDPFIKATEIIGNYIDQHSIELIDLSESLPSSARLIIDLNPHGEAAFAVVEPKNDGLTREIEYPKHQKKKKVLEIISPTGDVWCEQFAYQTFIRFIEEIGIHKIANLNLEVKPGIPLISEIPIENANSKPSEFGLYISTGIANKDKARIVKKICSLLGLKYKVHTFSIEV